MPKFEFTITADVTVSALVTVEASSIEEAYDIALDSSFYTDPANAKFELDEGNSLRDVYIPDESDFQILDSDVDPEDESAPSPGL